MSAVQCRVFKGRAKTFVKSLKFWYLYEFFMKNSRVRPVQEREWENWNRFLYFLHKKLLVALCSRRLEMRVWSLPNSSSCLSGARLTPDWSGLPFYYFFKQQFITSCTIVGVVKTLPLSSLWPSCGDLEIQIEVQPKLESFDCLTTFAVFPCIQL